MPRSYGQTTTSIWNDEDFTSLDTAEQAVYFMLKFQGEITAAGTLPLTLRRWAKHARDLDPERVEKIIRSLVERGHLAIDDDTEELLVVKFVKWDGGYKNSKRRPVIEAAGCAIRSLHLRRILARELRALDLPDMAASIQSDRAYNGLAAHPSDRASDRESGFDRVVVNEGDHIATHNPQPTTSEGAQPACPIPSGASAGPPSMFCPKHPAGTLEACGPCGTAKAARAEWNRRATQAEVDAKRARQEAIAGCGLCDDRGMRLDPDTRLPTGRCSHLVREPMDSEAAS